MKQPRLSPTPPDPALSALLTQWPPIEPAAGFQAAVWRGIRAQPAIAPAGLLIFPFSFARWAALAAVVLVSALGGILAAGSPASAPPQHRSAAFLLGHSTLAGSYLAMASGGNP